ncbi:MAG: hypothetical protein HYZ47_00120 [Simkania negevensis]|nr:hypothetical protein [Simkania negevensis]
MTRRKRMLYKDLAATTERKVSQEKRNEKLDELKRFIKSHNHLYDDCSFAIIGDRKYQPKFSEALLYLNNSKN